MTLISTVIGDAFRESNILPLGRAPNTNQTTEALRLFQQIIAAIYGTDAGENLLDWPLGNYGRQSPAYDLGYTECTLDHPAINRRLVAVNEEAKTVYFTLVPQDGARMGITDPFGRLAAFPVTLDGNGRTIEGAASIVLNVNGTHQEWFYRADLGDWVRITELAADDDMPFPQRYDAMFTIMLAIRINPRYGRELDEQSALVLKNGRNDFQSRYIQSQPLHIDDSVSWPFLSTQSYDQQREFSSARAFDRGSYFWGP